MSAVYSVDVEIRAPVRDTEVTDRVRDAVTALFPTAEMREEPGELVGEAHSLDHFSDLLHEQAILDTARNTFRDTLEGDTFTFCLKKQAAFVGKVNFAVGSESELGDLFVEVTVREPDADAYIEHVAPPTEDGVPVSREGDGDARER
ncbi:RNA-binding domain-containing protein [Halomarina litorea]|uniref:RNA-binding domain-containing protein n=1 Tax=Halomarina litorea TaxID=2961595 RepID=UPI0020C38A8A|nr:RNA-binding domain-containing protein [Halomarina sp. BCD28]